MSRGCRRVDDDWSLLRHAARMCGLALAALALGTVVSCGGDPTTPPAPSITRSAIMSGQPSTAEENFIVYLEVQEDPSQPLRRCSGVLLAPNVALTARHCLLPSTKRNLLDCTPEGEEVTDPSDPQANDLTLAPPESVRVFYGEQRSRFTSAASVALFATDTLGLCKNDVGLAVLERDLADVHVPLRLSPVRVGETITVSGWGLTDDPNTSPSDALLPETRLTRTAIRVAEVGPGLIPPGTFGVAGATLCYGDSGTGARIDGAVVGVYSFIQGPCALEQTRNVFMMTAAQRSLIDTAFARAGAVAWYAGEPPPWLAPVGTKCTADAACQLGRCDLTRGVCATPCGEDAGSSCSAGERCDATRGLCRSESDATPPAENACSTTLRGRSPTASHLSLIALGTTLAMATALRRSKRRTRTSAAKITGCDRARVA